MIAYYWEGGAWALVLVLAIFGSGLDQAYGQEKLQLIDPIAPPPYEYEGHEADATWRDSAQARIEEHRKADLEVTLVDARGAPVEGASVDVELTQHAFNFGTAVSDDLVNNDATYREHLREDVNYATIETGLKLYNWEDNPGRQQSVHDAVDWLNNHDFAVRGHAAFWEEWWWMDMDEGSGDFYGDMTPMEIHQTVQDKIEPRLQEFAGELRDWDTQNHPRHRQEIRPEVASGTDMSEVEVVSDWWATAQSADEQANMGINEQNILQKYDWAGPTGWVDWYENWILSLMEEGVDVDQIGFMGHANINRFEGIPQVLDLLDRFGASGLPLYVSEFHITLEEWWDESTTWADATQAEKDAQAAYLRDFLTAFFSHPAADTFVHWTYWEGRAWRRTSALYSPDWTLRDHGEMYRELVYDRWWTEEAGQTDAQGTYATRGFKGNYEVAVSDNGRTRIVPVTLSDGGASVEVSGIRPLYGSEKNLALGGGDDFVRLERSPPINTDGPFETRTVDLWFKAATVEGGTPQTLYEEGGRSTGFNIFIAGQELYAGAWNGQGGETPYPSWGKWFSTSQVEAGTWHHVALVYDEPNDRLRAYLDGEPFGSATPGGKVAAHPDDNGIGNRAGDTNFANQGNVNSPFEGRIDQMRVWDAGFSDQEVRTWMRQTVSEPLGREDLLAAYRFNERTLDATHSVNTVYEGGSAQFTASGAPLGQRSDVVADGAGSVGSVSVDVTSETEGDAVQLYQFGDPNGQVQSVASDAAESRLHLVWGLASVGGSPSADVTLDFSGAKGVNDPSAVKLLKREAPTDPWVDVTSDWTRDGRTFTKENVSSFSEFAVGGPRNSLPVELAGLRGTRADDGIELTWTTTSETNNAGFRILRADAGENGGNATWTEVGFVEGAGTTTESKRYRFTDREVPFAADALRYRLKQVDTDGTTTLGGTVTVERAPVDAARLLPPAPNPAREQVRVRFAVPEQDRGAQVALRLYDALGRQVRSARPDVRTGRHVQSLDLSGLSSGAYFLRLTVGDQTDTQRLTVVR